MALRAWVFSTSPSGVDTSPDRRALPPALNAQRPLPIAVVGGAEPPRGHRAQLDLGGAVPAWSTAWSG